MLLVEAGATCKKEERMDVLLLQRKKRHALESMLFLTSDILVTEYRRALFARSEVCFSSNSSVGVSS